MTFRYSLVNKSHIAVSDAHTFAPSRLLFSFSIVCFLITRISDIANQSYMKSGSFRSQTCLVLYSSLILSTIQILQTDEIINFCCPFRFPASRGLSRRGNVRDLCQQGMNQGFFGDLPVFHVTCQPGQDNCSCRMLYIPQLLFQLRSSLFLSSPSCACSANKHCLFGDILSFPRNMGIFEALPFMAIFNLGQNRCHMQVLPLCLSEAKILTSSKFYY